MAAEIPLNPEQAQQKFEGILEHGEGSSFLDKNNVDDRFQDSLAKLIAKIDSNTYLEGAEKGKLKVAVLKQVMATLSSVDGRLEGVLRSELAENTALRLSLYEEAISMVNTMNTGVGKQLVTAADYYHIDDDEFKTEVLGQVPYMISGIPKLDALAGAEAKTGKAPKAAMQSAASKLIESGASVFDHEQIARRYPGLKLPEKTYPCVRITSPENLRNMATGKVVRSAAVGEVFQSFGPLPPQGKYTYELVMDKRCNLYKLCTNDGNHVARIEYSKGSYHAPESANPGVDVGTLDQPLRTVVENGYATTDGVLTAEANPLSINQILPAGVQEVTMIFNQKLNGPSIPQGTPVTIKREGGSFVFTGEYKGLGRSDGRVRVYEGDELVFAVSSKPDTGGDTGGDTGSTGDTGGDTGRDTSDTGADEDTGEILERNEHGIRNSVASYWSWMRNGWEAPNVIDRNIQDKAVCAAYVQRTLEGFYGHDFAKEVFIQGGRYENGTYMSEHYVDAWELAGRIEESGYGHTAMDFTRYYSVDQAKQKVNVDTQSPGYDNDVTRLVNLAAQPSSRTGVLFMHFKKTKADSKIIANLDNGGSLNSHAMLILGQRGQSFNAPQPNRSLATSFIDHFKARLGESYDNSWEKNRYLLGTLKNVRVNGVELSFSEGEFRDAEGNVVGVKAGDKVNYRDTQVTDFYHNESTPGASPARVVGLTETMIQGNFDPVKLSQWDQAVVKNELPETSGDGFIVGEFRLDASVTDFSAALRESYAAQVRKDPEFGVRNPSAETYVKRTLSFLLRVHVINERNGLPVVGARIPVFDWSKKPTEATSVSSIKEDIVETIRTETPLEDWARKIKG